MDKFKINRVSASEQVCNHLQNLIAKGVYKPGDKLPSENELSDTFGVNRLTVRVAIQKLSAIGVVEVKQGSGSFVKEFDYEKYLTDAAVFFQRSGTLEYVSEFRNMIEIESAKLAMERATPKELEELRTLAVAHSDAWLIRKSNKEAWLNSAAAADIAFHEKIVQLSHNPLYIYAYTVARESIYQYILFCLHKYNDNHRIAVESTKRIDVHFEIYRAILEKNEDECTSLLDRMINSYSTEAFSMPEKV